MARLRPSFFFGSPAQFRSRPRDLLFSLARLHRTMQNSKLMRVPRWARL